MSVEYKALFSGGAVPGSIGWQSQTFPVTAIEEQMNKLAAEGWRVVPGTFLVLNPPKYAQALMVRGDG